MVVVQSLLQCMHSLEKGVKPLLPLLLLVCYTFFGAALFLLVEGPNERRNLHKLREKQWRLREDTAFDLYTVRGITPMESYNRTVELLDKYKTGLGVKDTSDDSAKWTFWGSAFYSVAVYTTIGYGNIVPVTTTGRVLTILYAFIGIPLAVLALLVLGRLIAKALKKLWSLAIRTSSCLHRDIGQKFQRINLEDVGEGEDNDDDLLRFPVMLLVFVTVLWVFVCAALFLIWEGTWDYGTSLYFTLISFMTIGFGDILPEHPKYMMAIGVLLLVGLALVSTLLNIIQEQINALAKGVKSSINNEYQAVQTTEEAGSGVLDKHSSTGVGAIVNKMPGWNRFLYNTVMPQSQKRELNNHYAKKAALTSKSCQTDDALLTSLVERLGQLNKSHDDINSLIGMCDYNVAQLQQQQQQQQQQQLPISNSLTVSK